MNEVLQSLKERRSIRKYKADMVPRELIAQILETGLYAANGMGEQKPIVIAVTNRELRDVLSEMNRSTVLIELPQGTGTFEAGTPVKCLHLDIDEGTVI